MFRGEFVCEFVSCTCHENICAQYFKPQFDKGLGRNTSPTPDSLAQRKYDRDFVSAGICGFSLPIHSGRYFINKYGLRGRVFPGTRIGIFENFCGLLSGMWRAVQPPVHNLRENMQTNFNLRCE